MVVNYGLLWLWQTLGFGGSCVAVGRSSQKIAGPWTRHQNPCSSAIVYVCTSCPKNNFPRRSASFSLISYLWQFQGHFYKFFGHFINIRFTDSGYGLPLKPDTFACEARSKCLHLHLVTHNEQLQQL